MTSESYAADRALTFEHGPHPDVGGQLKPIGHLPRVEVAQTETSSVRAPRSHFPTVFHGIRQDPQCDLPGLRIFRIGTVDSENGY